MTAKIDEERKTGFSYAFRVILIFFAIYLLYYSENIWEWWVYGLVTIIYFTLFIILKERNLSIPRLLNDFVFIIFIVYGKDFHNPIALIFILLPIINSPNHSGVRGSPFILIVLSFAALCYLIRDSTYFNSKEVNFYVFLIVPILLILGILTYERYQVRFSVFKDALNIKIDSFYSEQLNKLPEPYKLLQEITSTLNGMKHLEFEIDLLICFTYEKERLNLLASSKFIFAYKFLDRKRFLNDLKEDGFTTQSVIFIDNVKHGNTLSYSIVCNNKRYIYVLIATNLSIISYRDPLKNVFTRLTNLMGLEDFLYDQKLKYLEKLKNKIEFMDDAQMSMHFIKNKLGPISNFIAMCREFSSEPPPKEIWSDHLNKERVKADANLGLILKKTETFHKNVESIFSFTGYENVSIMNVLVLLRRSWSAYFSDDTILLNIRNLTGYHLEINDDLFEIFLNNWCSNMAKYHNKSFSLAVDEEPTTIEIVFLNDISPEGLEDAKSFIHDFNSEGKAEIVKRTIPTQGLRELRYLVKEMGLDCRLVLHDHFLTLRISISKKYENSNH